MKRIVWKWKANIADYAGKPGVVGIWIIAVFPNDNCLVGRDGYVGFEEEYSNVKKNLLEKEGNKDGLG